MSLAKIIEQQRLEALLEAQTINIARRSPNNDIIGKIWISAFPEDYANNSHTENRIKINPSGSKITHNNDTASLRLTDLTFTDFELKGKNAAIAELVRQVISRKEVQLLLVNLALQPISIRGISETSAREALETIIYDWHVGDVDNPERDRKIIDTCAAANKEKYTPLPLEEAKILRTKNDKNKRKKTLITRYLYLFMFGGKP